MSALGSFLRLANRRRLRPPGWLTADRAVNGALVDALRAMGVDRIGIDGEASPEAIRELLRAGIAPRAIDAGAIRPDTHDTLLAAGAIDFTVRLDTLRPARFDARHGLTEGWTRHLRGLLAVIARTLPAGGVPVVWTVLDADNLDEVADLARFAHHLGAAAAFTAAGALDPAHHAIATAACARLDHLRDDEGVHIANNAQNLQVLDALLHGTPPPSTAGYAWFEANESGVTPAGPIAEAEGHRRWTLLDVPAATAQSRKHRVPSFEEVIGWGKWTRA